MGCNSERTKRNWVRDNETEGRFEEVLDVFPYDEVRAELEAANAHKVGAPFRVPDCVIGWAAQQIVGHGMGYRAAARRITAEMDRLGLPGIKHSQLNKRIRRLRIHDGTTVVTDARIMAFGTGAEPRPGKVEIAIDSTGLSPDRPSGWRVYHWNQKSVRGWYKLHAAVNVKTSEILAYVVTEPYLNDVVVFELLIDLVRSAGHEISLVLADAAYDDKRHWTLADDLGFDFIANIKGSLNPRKRNSGSGKSKGCMSRARHIRRILKVGRRQWMAEVGYSRRWKVEAAFSDLKRRFGDTLRARGRESVANMIGWFVIVFNLFKRVRWSD